MRENNLVESYKELIENRNRLAEIHENAVNEKNAKREKFIRDYHDIIESREMKLRRHGMLMESCRDDAFGKVLKAIYITALESATLTDNGLLLAESMVDTWIKENGGAKVILGKCKDKTYLLSRISEIVEQAAILETEEIENIDDDKIDTEEETTEDSKDEPTSAKEDEVALAAKVIEKNLDTSDEEVAKALEIIKKKSGQATDNSSSDDTSKDAAVEDAEKELDNDSNDNDDDLDDLDIASGDGDVEDTDDDDKEDKSDDKSVEELDDSVEEKPEESKEEPAAEENSDDNGSKDESSDTSEEDGSDTFDDVDGTAEENSDEEVEDSEETDVADDIVDDLEDAPEEDITVDGDTSNDGKVFDELEKETDVKKAIEVIRQRVADAEQTFIKRNAEDKKAIDELIGKISDNVKTVEDISNDKDPKSEVAEEAARLCKQKINAITENRTLSVFEKMTRNIHYNVIRNQVVKESYTNESGAIDTALVVETAKVMYGFLETLNTLQLEKVDEKYIQNILNEM